MTQVKNLNIVGIDTAKNLMHAVIKHRLDTNVQRDFINICLHGSPGLGKSSIVQQLAEDLEMRLIDLRLSAMQESDVLGIPYVYQGEMKFSTPEWWPDESKPTILFLDELKSAPPAVQTAAYRLILDRSIQNGSVLPNNVFIIAAGNLKEDKTGARDLLPAAANRFGLHLLINRELAAEPFLNYAVNKGFDRTLIGYLEWKKDAIYGEIGQEAAFATPRTWEDVNKYLKIPSFTTKGAETTLTTVIAGAVGNAAAMDFMAYRENAHLLPDWNRIRNGDKSYNYTVSRGDGAVEYAVATGLAFEMLEAMRDEKRDDVKNLASVIFPMLSNEMVIVCFRTMKRDMSVATRMFTYEAILPYWDKVKSFMKS